MVQSKENQILHIKTNKKVIKGWSTLVAQWVKDSALSLLWLGFDPWELLHPIGTAKKEKRT